MLVNGKHFPGSTFYVDTQNTLRSIAGNASMFTEFVPVHFPNIRTFHKLLFHFYRHGLCCFMTGSFVSYIACFLTLFRAATIYMVLDDCHPIVRLIFQMGSHAIPHFIIVFLFWTFTNASRYLYLQGAFGSFLHDLVFYIYRCRLALWLPLKRWFPSFYLG